MTVKPTYEELEQQVADLKKEILARKQIESELRESEEKFKTIFQSVNDEIVYIDTDGTIVELNDRIENFFGYKREEVIGRKFSEFDFLKPEFLQKSIEILNDVVSGKPAQGIVEFEGTSKKGKRVFFEGSSGIIKEDGKIKGVLVIVRDITERKQKEKELLAYQEKLRSLSNELLLTEELERRRIATDLHDSIGQSLAFAKIKLGVVQEASTSNEFKEELDKIRKLIEQTISDTRTLTFELSPPVLYELGFEAAVEWFIEQIQKQHDISIEYTDDGHHKPMRDSTKILMFRAARELLINVVKHADTTKAKVTIQKDKEKIKFIIQDNGAGFDTSKINAHLQGTGGFGLFSIQDRLSHIGGHLNIESKYGKGTKVTMIAPIV